jgi:hypothetical protein
MAPIAALLVAASIEIAFTNSITHAPIPDLTVTLKGPSEYTVTTDGAGVARIPNAAPGNYTLGFESSGFVAPPYAHEPIAVGAEEVRLDFALTPLGKVHGRVLFPDGGPVAGAKITLALYRFLFLSTTTTDTRGRFTAIAPTRGRFTLSAGPQVSAELPDGEDWAVTYYPDVTSRSDADAIPLPLGADLSGYDIRLRSVPVRRVAGVVRDDTGRPAAGATVKLTAEEKERQAVVGEDGAFTFPAIAMGEWTLLASLKRGDTDLLGFERLTVARRDIDGLDLRLNHPFSIPVTVAWDGPPNPKPNARLAVSLIPEPGRGYFREGAKPDPDGSLRFRSVYPGAYTVMPVTYSPGFYLDSILLGDREILGQRVELVEGVPPLHIVYRYGVASLRARVDKGAGATVAVVPQEDGLIALSIFNWSTLAGNDGSCEIRSLRPGDYYVWAFRDFDGEALKDPLFVSRLIPRAEKVHLDENGSATVSLKVTPWPE